MDLLSLIWDIDVSGGVGGKQGENGFGAKGGKVVNLMTTDEKMFHA